MKWILTKKASGKVRSMETVNIFAVCNAFAEQLPFTVLVALTGRPCTHNMPESK